MSNAEHVKEVAYRPVPLDRGVGGDESTNTTGPIFEVLEIVNGGYGRTYRIWADGRTEGFEFRHIILNRITVMADYQTAIALERREQDLLVHQHKEQCRQGWVCRIGLRLDSLLRALRLRA